MQGLIDRLGQIESLINNLLSGALNQSRIAVLNDHLDGINRQREEHLSENSESNNQDEIRLMLDSQENMFRRLYDV